MWNHPCYCVSLTFSTTVSRKHGVALRKQQRRMTTKVRTMWSIPLRSIRCNGYKDENYIERALLAQKVGKQIFIVVEKMNELEIIANKAKKMGIRPNIGIRIKLASSGSGKWEE